MDRLVIVLSAVLLFNSIISEVYAESETSNDDHDKRKLFWFGPRLGRRKRNEDIFKSPLLQKEQLIALADVLEETPWAIVAVNGRESGEELINNNPTGMGGDRWLQDSDVAGELMSQRSPPFAPRLGRRVLPFSPRLGRETDRS